MSKPDKEAFTVCMQVMEADLNAMVQQNSMGITMEMAEKIMMDMNRPHEEILHDVRTREYLDQIERRRL